jgi:hypothetical protein
MVIMNQARMKIINSHWLKHVARAMRTNIVGASIPMTITAKVLHRNTPFKTPRK